MTGQLLALVGFVLLVLFLRERALYRENHPPSNCAQERDARERLRPRTGEVDPAPAACPVYPLDMARSRRDRRPDRPAA